VVSDRAIKHVTELTEAHAACMLARAPASFSKEQPDSTSGVSTHSIEHKALQPGGPKGEYAGVVRAAVLFLVNRSDCAAFRPCHEADPLFAAVLRRAKESGAGILCMGMP
jgi:DNA-binding sugar fermentation-stimulating protein